MKKRLCFNQLHICDRHVIFTDTGVLMLQNYLVLWRVGMAAGNGRCAGSIAVKTAPTRGKAKMIVVRILVGAASAAIGGWRCRGALGWWQVTGGVLVLSRLKPLLQ